MKLIQVFLEKSEWILWVDVVKCLKDIVLCASFAAVMSEYTDVCFIIL